MRGFCPLASGSKGNCIYLGSRKTKILIDAGISAKQLESRLGEIGVKLSEIDAILVSHEHMDHIAALKVLSSGKNSCKVFCNSETAKGIYENLNVISDFKIFTTDEPFCYQDLEITPFSILHDTLDPVGFAIKVDGLKLGFCTDLGYVTTHVVQNLKDCDYLYIESNHQPAMVHASNRSFTYKQRVLSRQGHLSNEESCFLLREIMGPKLKQIYIAHLSQECNSPTLAKEMMERDIDGKDIKIMVAYQDKVSQPVIFD